jgi:hypothetical protein
MALYAGLVGVVLSASPLFAVGPGVGPGGGGGKGGKGKGIPGPGGGGGGTPIIPEISRGTAASALALLAGGTLILTDRLRRRSGSADHARS